MRSRISNFTQDFLSSIDLERHLQEIQELIRFLRAAGESGGKTYFLGNGASASISSTLAFKALAEQRLPTLAINDHNLLLGMSRKRSFAEWMEVAAQNFVAAGDSLVLTSSSGESPNVVNLAKWAKSNGIPVFSLTGFQPTNELRSLSGSSLWVDSMNYNVVETAHLLLGLIAVRALELPEGVAKADFQECVEELRDLDWKLIIEKLAVFSEELRTIDYRNQRIVFVGDGSSASLASHLATDFSKSGLTAQALNDHSFLSASQNDFGSLDWISVGIDRSFRPGDTIVFISHSELFPAERKAIQASFDGGIAMAHHGTVSASVALPKHREVTYDVSHPASELVAPSIGLLAIAEAFLPENA